MYFSIKTKFIILLSVLMAVILGIQFYFTQQTQNDIIEELTRMSAKINQATDIDFSEQNHFFNKRSASRPGARFRKPPKWFFSPNIDSLIKSSEEQLNIDENTKLPGDRQDIVEDEIRLRTIIREHNISGLSGHTGNKQLASQTGSINVTLEDTLNWFVNEIDVNLNTFDRRKPDSVNYTYKFRDRLTRKKKPPSFTFVIPDFSEPKFPRIVRLNYSTADIQSAIGQIRNKNILITVIIFIISIFVIMLITRRFLKPIDSLKVSFEKVVDGDLDVTVRNNSKDEIGRLTGAFNKMVSELRKNKEKEILLNRKERLASLGQLAAGVAHEIKNPLNAINLTIEHLGSRLRGEEHKQTHQYIATIQDEIKRLDKIVNNFLNYLRSEELEKKSIDLNELINDILQLYNRELKTNNVELETHFTNRFLLKADPERMKTALVNIILNAIQSMPEGGQLIISVDSERKQICIRDTGSGIEEKDIEYVFDIFYTTKSSGSGLGLPTAYKIIQAHGGEIRINSKPGIGTEVVLEF